MTARRLVAKLIDDPASLPAGLSFEDWQEAGATLFTIVSGVQWAMGEWWLYGETQFGEEAAQALPLDYQLKTIQNAAWVASAIPSSRRRVELSFSHHAEVAGLPPDEQDRLLSLAVDKQLSVRELRLELRPARAALNGNTPDPVAPTPTVIELDPVAWNEAADAIERSNATTPKTLAKLAVTAYLKALQ